MSFNLAPSSSNQAEGPCIYPSTPLQRPCYLSAASTPSTPSTPSYHSNSPSGSPLVSTTGSAAGTTSDADDDIFPLTPNSKGSSFVTNNGAGLQTLHCPESECGDPPHRRSTSFEDQYLFERLSGRSVDSNDRSETISERAKAAYMNTLQQLSPTSFQCVIHYLEAVRERHRMLYHAACWEVSECARWEALARSMHEDLKKDYVNAEQEVRFLLEILGQRMALTHHPVANCSAEVHTTARLLSIEPMLYSSS
ncbi:hypothetical protein DFJ58DRAFT_739364 [Suillus subalutaceus]|uniref:uncharacterized protein n=1 Tax=Suillus subalutaceus TaxID=48586 RepID=UPI001B870136|nr:uncharacterized protein DFJ58DRAFT_739364 [Suillus subalutaceus]KAG1820001.1 hypothetical protein DFJ58DRAFT_739364 [Suillus subalutaceus]